jgi:hypothetical protein
VFGYVYSGNIITKKLITLRDVRKEDFVDQETYFEIIRDGKIYYLDKKYEIT